jgi:hypothetical protein
MAAFELQACGYLKIRAALEALEEQERFCTRRSKNRPRSAAIAA